MIICSVLLPDVNALWQDADTAWRVYLGLSQVSLALLCLLPWFAGVVGGTRTLCTAASAWFIGQAIDEFANGNFFKDGVWEYGWLLVCSIILYIITNDRKRTKGTQASLDH